MRVYRFSNFLREAARLRAGAGASPPPATLSDRLNYFDTLAKSYRSAPCFLAFSPFFFAIGLFV